MCSGDHQLTDSAIHFPSTMIRRNKRLKPPLLLQLMSAYPVHNSTLTGLCDRCMAVAFAKAGAAKVFLFGRDEKSLAETAQLAEKAGKGCQAFTYSLDLSKANVDAPLGQMLQVHLQASLTPATLQRTERLSAAIALQQHRRSHFQSKAQSFDRPQFADHCSLMHLQDAGGKLDVLVNNAGVLEEWKPLNDSDPAVWWGSYEVNVRCNIIVSAPC